MTNDPKTVTIPLPSTMTVKLARDAGTIELDLTKMDPSIFVAAVHQRLEHKIQDTANSEKAVAKMPGKTIQERTRAKAEQLRDQLYRGVWALKTGGGGPKLDDKARFMRQEAIKAAKDYIQAGKYIVNGRAVTKVSDSDAVKAVSDKYLATPAWFARVEARYVPPVVTVPDLDIDPFAAVEPAKKAA